MSTGNSKNTKKVTYRDGTDDDVDYLSPLQGDVEIKLSKKPKKSNSFFASIYLLITLFLYVPVPITQFVIGIIYVNQCPFRQFLPIYMIISGILGILFVVVGLLIFLFFQPRICPGDRSLTIRILQPIFILLFLNVIGWWIAGQVLVLEIKVHVDITYPTVPEYCQLHLYKGAYVLIFVNYIVALITTILFIVRRIDNGSGSTAKKKKPNNLPMKK